MIAQLKAPSRRPDPLAQTQVDEQVRRRVARRASAAVRNPILTAKALAVADSRDRHVENPQAQRQSRALATIDIDEQSRCYRRSDSDIAQHQSVCRRRHSASAAIRCSLDLARTPRCRHLLDTVVDSAHST